MTYPNFRFTCDICKQQITVGKSECVRGVRKESTGPRTSNNLETYVVESECVPGEIHVNIVVVDAQGNYRGHKHATRRKAEIVTEAIARDVRRLLKFGKDFSKIITCSLRYDTIVFCGEEEKCNLWASIVSRVFSIKPYEIAPWLALIKDMIREYGKTSIPNCGKIILLDTGLINQALKVFPNRPVIELRTKQIHNGVDSKFTKQILKLLLALPDNEDKAFATILNSSISDLRALLDEIVAALNEHSTGTIVVGADNLSLTQIVQNMMSQVLPRDVYDDLIARVRFDELDILAPHIVRQVDSLCRAIESANIREVK